MGEPPDPNEDLKTLSVQLANQIINIANKKLEDGTVSYTHLKLPTKRIV